MTATLTAAVVAIGDELLLGDVINTNAAWLGAALASVGVPVVSSVMVGDDLAPLEQAVRRALTDADVVILTGGLGPTSDDRTRTAVAAVAGVPLERSAAIEDKVRRLYASYDVPMVAEQVLVQADVPRGATALDNPAGTAPGLRLQLGDALLYALPGPPHELHAVFDGSVRGELAERSGTVLITRTLRTAGLGESAVAALVEPVVSPPPPGVALAYLAGTGIVRVRFTGVDESELTPLLAGARAALGRRVWGVDEETLPGVILQLLVERGATVGTAESLTGGLVGAALSQPAGSSAAFRGGLIVYATDLKASLAQVPADLLAEQGAVSAATSGALAEGARDRTSASYGVSTTGVAGPDEQEGKPVGTFHVAVAGPSGTVTESWRVPGDRERVRAWAVTAALDLLRRTLEDDPGEDDPA